MSRLLWRSTAKSLRDPPRRADHLHSSRPTRSKDSDTIESGMQQQNLLWGVNRYIVLANLLRKPWQNLRNRN